MDLMSLDKLFGFYDTIDECREDLINAAEAKELTFEIVESLLILKLKIELNKRTKYLRFKLTKDNVNEEDKFKYL